MDNSRMDPFNEDKTEREFLNSKPTCFIIIGKPGCGKSTLAKNLSKVWKCELINGMEVLNMAIEMQTELGVKAQEILQRGEAIPEELASKLLLEKINSPEVKHHGYILDGFPSLSEDWLSLADQLELVKNLPMTPDFIINVKIPDKDLELRRKEQKLDPLTGIVYTKSEYTPQQTEIPLEGGLEEEEEGDDDEAEEDEEELNLEDEIEYPEEEEREEIGPELLARLVTRPEDLPQNITASIKLYKDMVLRSLEDYMADHDPQKLIELDGNEGPRVLFKSLMTKLNTFVLNRALVPLRLQSDESEEISDDTDTDDLLRTLAAAEMMAPKFRWRRSKWGRNCPVALKEGNIVQGIAQFGVSFLDKIYVMSSPEALGQFMRNPRPYLANNLPCPPCKLYVLGPPHSGKSEVAKKLAAKYNAKIFSMDELIKPKQEAAKKKMLEEIKEEAIQSAISKVTAARQTMQAEQGDDEEEKASEKTGEDEDDDDDEKKDAAKPEGEGEEGEEGEKTEEAEGEAVEAEGKSETEESKADDDKSEAASEQSEKPRKKSVDELPIDANHPEVIKMVNEVMAEAEKKEPELSTDDYVEVLDEAIQKRSEELLATDPNGPSAGGYVVDGFPRTREHFSAMIERGIYPDEVICLKDESENGEFLLKRWYSTNKEELHAKWQARMAEQRAKQEAIRAERERLRREEEERQAAEEAKRKAEEAAEAGEGEEEGEEKEDKEGGEEEEKSEEPAEKEEPDTEETAETSSADIKPSAMSHPSDEDVGEGEEELQLDGDIPPETPETEEFKRQRTNFDRDFLQLISVLKGTNNIEPINVSVEKDLESISADVVKKVEAPFNYRAWEYTGMDQDEEEEDAEAAEDEDDEDEEGGDPFTREKKKIFGDTKYYCPVLLKENNVLIPGQVDIAARYRERTYFFSSMEARDKFLNSPDNFLPVDEPLKKPPIRLLIIGPKGSGKTLHGRYLAKKLGLFHISFTERLQELIIAKTKKKIGPEYEDDEEEEQPAPEEHETAQGAFEALEQDEEKPNPEDELTEDEENIKSSLAYGDPLSSEILDRILPGWWNEEPFSSTGFVLEGFPRNDFEARYLANNGLLPDAGVLLAVEDTDIVKRLLPPLLDKWKKKRDKRVAEKERLKAIARQEKMELRAKRREEKLAEIEAIRAERQARKQARESDDSEDEDEEEDENIEAIMDAEFEEEEEEEDDEEEEESEEDAIERIKTELGERYDEEVGRLSVVQEAFEELMISRVEINGGRKPRIVRYCIDRALQPIVDFRDCLFERCFPIDPSLANRMIAGGYKFPSRFGRWCPVKLLEGEVIQPQYGGGGGTYYTCPVVYRQHIYFCCNDTARDAFIQQPLKYLNQPSPKPVVPIRIAIIGPPKSGKTSLAKRFASEFGVVRLSIGEAIRRVLDNQKHTELAKQINVHLRSGKTVPDELAVQSLEIALLDMQSQTRGFILDGYPLTTKQVQLMTERKIIPVKVLELVVNDEELLRRGMDDRNDSARVLPLHDSHQILAIRLNCWKQEVGAVREWYQNEHRNWVPLNGQRSKWWVWNVALDEARKSVKQIQIYLERIGAGKSASIADMCITHKELLARLGDFGQYCPVSLADRGELVDCSTSHSLEFAAEFRARYYKLGSRADLEKFLAEPARYVPPLAPRKLPEPNMLPRRRTSADVKAMFPAQIEMQGYCPVTFWDGRQRYENIVPGNPELVVEYRQKLYYFASEGKLEKFMRLPELYHGLQLPHKLPPAKDPSLAATALPMLGYMEQTAANAIIKAATAAGCFKPKYPFLDAKRSALLYIAYHLKAYNPKSSDFVRRKYKKKLMQFEEQCELIQYLGKEMTTQYRKPEERPIDFDHKLNNFLSLKGMEV